MIKKENLHKIEKQLFADKLDFISAFRRNIYMYLEDDDVNMSELAERSGVNLSTLKTFMYSNAKDINLSNAIKLAHALNVSVDELIGADTIPAPSRESLRMCREMPENDLLLVRWFIRYLYALNQKTEPNKRYVSVMLPELNNNGDYKLISKFEKVEITNLEEPLRSKIFIGFKLINDYYMPYYLPNNIILVANDRLPMQNEHVLVRAGDYIFIVKRIVEDNVAKYYSIRDDKYRIDEDDVDELIGYIAHVIK